MFGRKKQEDDAAKPAGEARDAKPAGKINDAKPAGKINDAKPVAKARNAKAAGKTGGDATGPLPLLSESPEASPDLKPPPRTPVNLPKKPRPSVSLPEKPRRVPDMPSGRGHRPDQPGGNDGRKLIVAREIVLKCEISQCDRLVVEGHVEATMKDCKEIDIAETGTFKGHVEFDRADISGIFEGELTAREHLVVRATGRVTGTVRFGELEIERGGQVIGDMQVYSNGKTAERDAKIAVDTPAE